MQMLVKDIYLLDDGKRIEIHLSNLLSMKSKEIVNISDIKDPTTDRFS